MKTPKLFKKYISPLVTIENKTKNQTNKKQTWRTLPPSLEKKNESKIKKLKSVLEKNVRKKNVSKELRTYLKKHLKSNCKLSTTKNYVYLELSQCLKIEVYRARKKRIGKKKQERKKKFS